MEAPAFVSTSPRREGVHGLIRRCLLLLIAGLSLIFGGAGRGAGLVGTPPTGGTAGPATPTVQVEVLNADALPLPAGCGDPERFVGLILDFLDVFNRGDQQRLDRFFVADRFEWYSVTEASGGGYMDDETAELTAYFRQRHDRHERLALQRLAINKSWNPDRVAFDYVLTREADDFRRRTVAGKGEVYCPARTIFVWSMADQHPRATPQGGAPTG